MFVIVVNTISNYNQWVLDTDCGSHICADTRGLMNSRKITKGESDLQVGDGARVVVVVIWTYVLNPPSGFCLNLDDCCYVPTFTKTLFLYLILSKMVFI